MFKRIRKTHHKCRQAFTLAELIVVLVILAILGAILVPALTGYVKRAKKSKYIPEVDAFRTAAQAIVSECYGKGTNTIPEGQNVYWDDVDGVSDENKKWGEKVLQLMGYGRGEANHEPYILVIGVGAPKNTDLSAAQKYTVYYVGYVHDKNAPAVFYLDGEYFYTYPTKNPKYINSTKTTQTVNGESVTSVKNTIIKTGVEITYFVISNRTGLPNEGNSSNGQKNFWTTGSGSFQGRAEKSK